MEEKRKYVKSVVCPACGSNIRGVYMSRPKSETEKGGWCKIEKYGYCPKCGVVYKVEMRPVEEVVKETPKPEPVVVPATSGGITQEG